MKNSQKGFIVPLLVIIAVLVISGGVYVYFQKPPTEQNVVSGDVYPSNSASSVGTEIYTNTKYGFTLNFPSSWSGYQAKEWKDNYYSVSFGIKDQERVFSITAYNKAQWTEYQSGDLKPAQFIAQNDRYVFAWTHDQDYTNAVYPLTAQLQQIISTFRFIK